jgi:hypothetical protein
VFTARQHFSALQHKTFPVYFLISIITSSALLGIWISKHPDVLHQLGHPMVADVAQVYALGNALFAQALNYFFIGPLTGR